MILEAKRFQITLRFRDIFENLSDKRHRKSWQNIGLERPNELADFIWLSHYSWADKRRKGEGENSNKINIPGGWNCPLTGKAVDAAVQTSLLDKDNLKLILKGFLKGRKVLASAAVTLLLTLSELPANSASFELEVPALVWTMDLMLLLTYVWASEDKLPSHPPKNNIADFLLLVVSLP